MSRWSATVRFDFDEESEDLARERLSQILTVGLVQAAGPADYYRLNAPGLPDLHVVLDSLPRPILYNEVVPLHPVEADQGAA